MQRLSIGAGLLIWACGLALGQDAPTRDPRVDELAAETAQLRRIIADQERRIAELEKSGPSQPSRPNAAQERTITAQERRIADLEKTVRTLQAPLAPAPRRIPSSPPDWHMPVNWGRLKAGLSEAQVVELLGPPTRVQSVVDTRTLYYEPDRKSTSTIHGSVILMDDRVIAVEPPDF